MCAPVFWMGSSGFAVTSEGVAVSAVLAGTVAGVAAGTGAAAGVAVNGSSLVSPKLQPESMAAARAMIGSSNILMVGFLVGWLGVSPNTPRGPASPWCHCVSPEFASIVFDHRVVLSADRSAMRAREQKRTKVPFRGTDAARAADHDEISWDFATFAPPVLCFTSHFQGVVAPRPRSPSHALYRAAGASSLRAFPRLPNTYRMLVDIARLDNEHSPGILLNPRQSYSDVVHAGIIMATILPT